MENNYLNKDNYKILLYLLIISYCAFEIAAGYKYIYSYLPEDRTVNINDLQIQETKVLNSLEVINIVLTAINIVYCVLAIMYLLSDMIDKYNIKLIKDK